MRKTFSPERLREIIWDVGQRYPIPPQGDAIALLMVHPRLGHVTWHVREQSVGDTRSRHEGAFSNASLIVRLYDVTDIIFDGFNAHMFFDLDVGKPAGNYYFRVDRLARNYLAEIGMRNTQGRFHPFSRSNTAFFDRDRPSGNYQTGGLFVGKSLQRIFPVENMFDAPVYERMNHELAGGVQEKALSIAVVFLGIDHASGLRSPLGHFIGNLSTRIGKFVDDARLFRPSLREPGRLSGGPLLAAVDELSAGVAADVGYAQRQKPIDIIHCHDWYSSAVGLAVKKEFGTPMVLTLHSTEHERLQGNEMNSLSLSICEREKGAVAGADLVIVPHSSTRQQVITLYEAPPEKVVIVPDVLDEESPAPPRNAADVKGWLGLNKEAPTALFAGEISHAAGADLLVDALPTVCRNHRSVQFIFAGDGPLKGELERRVLHAGIGRRCRFLGDVSKETFDAILGASDFVVIPARTWQDEGLAQAAIASGRPVLTTRQAGIHCIVHGENGLVTFDNPGSIVWGIQEMLHNPLQGSMLRFTARKRAGETRSVEIAAVQHYMYYEMLLKKIKESRNA
jgi:glycosyltransferase involved in cell wall biosynthesis